MSEENEKKDPPPPSLSPPPPTPKEPELPSGPPRAAAEPLEVKTKPATVDVEDSNEAGEIAPLNSRLLGGIIDSLVGLGLYFTVIWLLPDFFERFAWLLVAAYWITRDSLPFLKGQSIGKMAMKTKVVKLDGSETIGDWPTAIVRNVALLVPFFGAVEAIILITRDNKAERGRRLGDEWAKTKVVNAPDSTEDQD